VSPAIAIYYSNNDPYLGFSEFLERCGNISFPIQAAWCWHETLKALAVSYKVNNAVIIPMYIYIYRPISLNSESEYAMTVKEWKNIMISTSENAYIILCCVLRNIYLCFCLGSSFRVCMRTQKETRRRVPAASVDDRGKSETYTRTLIIHTRKTWKATFRVQVMYDENVFSSALEHVCRTGSYEENEILNNF